MFLDTAKLINFYLLHIPNIYIYIDEAELTPKIRPQFVLQTTNCLHEVLIIAGQLYRDEFIYIYIDEAELTPKIHREFVLQTTNRLHKFVIVMMTIHYYNNVIGSNSNGFGFCKVSRENESSQKVTLLVVTHVINYLIV